MVVDWLLYMVLGGIIVKLFIVMYLLEKEHQKKPLKKYDWDYLENLFT